MTDKELTELNDKLTADPSVLALSQTGRGGPVPTRDEEAKVLASVNGLVSTATQRLVRENGLSVADATMKVGSLVPNAAIIRRRMLVTL